MSVCFLFVALFFLVTMIVYVNWSNDIFYGETEKHSFKIRAVIITLLGFATVLNFVIACSHSSAREVIAGLLTPGGVVYYECDKQALPDLGIDLSKIKPIYFEEKKLCSKGCRYRRVMHSGSCDGNRVHYYLVFRKSDLIDTNCKEMSDYDKIIKEAASE